MGWNSNGLFLPENRHLPLLPMIPRKRWDEILSFSVNLVDLSLCVNLRELHAGSLNVLNEMTQLKRLSIYVRGRNADSPLRIESLLPVVARLDDVELLGDWNEQDDNDEWYLQLQKYVMGPSGEQSQRRAKTFKSQQQGYAESHRGQQQMQWQHGQVEPFKGQQQRQQHQQYRHWRSHHQH